MTTSPASRTVDRRLATFTGAGYDKGRPIPTQVLWFATMNLVFMKWWFPARWRPALLRAFGATIGDRVLIRHRLRVLWPWKLTVGDDCWLGEDVWLLNLEPITIGHDVCISQGAFVCTGNHDARDPAMAFRNRPISIGDGAWVGAMAFLAPGTIIAPGAFVPARPAR